MWLVTDPQNILQETVFFLSCENAENASLTTNGKPLSVILGCDLRIHGHTFWLTEVTFISTLYLTEVTSDHDVWAALKLIASLIAQILQHLTIKTICDLFFCTCSLGITKTNLFTSSILCGFCINCSNMVHTWFMKGKKDASLKGSVTQTMNKVGKGTVAENDSIASGTLSFSLHGQTSFIY